MFCSRIPESLYIHIPFCKKKCSYCDFFSLTNHEDSFVDNILEETINQINYFNKQLNIDHLKTIYMGGGTPSVIETIKLEKFIKTVVSMYNTLPKEFSIEINPETVNKDLIIMLNHLPVTRISLGAQSFNKKMLAALGRNCSLESVYNGLKLVKKYSNKDISIDIISSIPGQTVSEALSDITTALSFKPDHISLYYLTIEKGTKLSEKFTEKDQDDNCWAEACGLLELSGYNHYEISNFCLPGKECLHNMNYWKMEPYIGCGLSAVSTIYEKELFYRISVTDNSSLFLEGEKSLWGMAKEKISKSDFVIELIMMGLRTKEGVNIAEIDSFFNIDLKKIVEPVISKWDKKGFINHESSNLALTSSGRYFHTSFMIDIMNSLENSKFCFT